jgi:hypothetical protein
MGAGRSGIAFTINLNQLAANKESPIPSVMIAKMSKRHPTGGPAEPDSPDMKPGMADMHGLKLWMLA